ncbi:MAG: uncharacterized protein QOK02_915 [Mycobacterium sp.]|nr:uncharacterized protein [Mycobacterium sp.]
MNPNSSISAATLDLEPQPVPADQTVNGRPGTGAHTLTDFAGVEVGVWEMTPGVMTDVEADEVFVVLSGAATVEFGDGSPTISISQGDVVRLAQGAETVWTVTETLRKIYLVSA